MVRLGKSPFSYDNFVKCCEQIAQVSNKISDNWQLHKTAYTDYGIYLSKKYTVTFSDQQTVVTIEIHVVYNTSYNSPMLCFNMSRPNGSLLTMEEYWKEFSSEFNEMDMYKTITQMDHPVLCLPFLTLHPCKFHDILEGISTESKNMLISWLSAVGPAVKIEMVGYFHCCF